MSGKLLSPSRQVVFHQMLVAARKSLLMDALSEVLGQLDPKITKEQILTYVPAAAQKILAAAGIRDEHVFPVPAVLDKKPTLVGYYRLLLGISQKRFYRKGTEMGSFKAWRRVASSTQEGAPILSASAPLWLRTSAS